MIEDIEGATAEPTRRRHVRALSAAVAAVSLVMLFMLVVPPDLGPAPQAASPLPSATAAPVMTIVSGLTTLLQSGTWYRQSGMPADADVNVKLMSECSNGTQINPPYYLVFEGNGQVMAVPLDPRTAPSPQFTPVDRGSGWLTVSCATSTIRVPRIDRGR